MWHSARACTGSDRSRLQPPSAVSVAVECLDPSVGVEPDLPERVESVPLARHGHVLGAVEPQPNRSPGEPGAERGDRGVAVRLHLLAAEAAAHPQALHGDLGVRQAEDVRDDLLRLAGVLRRRLDEHLPVLVDAGERGVGLQVEVLLSGELELAFEDVRAGGPRRLRVAAPQDGPGALEAFRRDRLGDGDQRRQRLVADLDGRGAEPGRLQRLAEHPAHRVPRVHHLAREQRLVVLDPGVVHTGHVVRGEHADHTGHGECRVRAQRRHPGVGVRGLHGIRVQAAGVPVHQVVGVERETGDVQVRALVLDRRADHRIVGTQAQLGHADTS